MTAIKYTMTPDEVERWSANPASVMHYQAARVVRVKESRRPTPSAGYATVSHLGTCGHPVYKGATVCRACWKAQLAVQKQERQDSLIASCGHLAKTLNQKRCGACRKAAGDARRTRTKSILERMPDQTVSPNGRKSRLLRAGSTIVAVEEFLPLSLACNLEGCSELATKTGRCERHETIWVRLHA